MIYFPKCEGEGSFPKSQIKSLLLVRLPPEGTCLGGGGGGGGGGGEGYSDIFIHIRRLGSFFGSKF